MPYTIREFESRDAAVLVQVTLAAIRSVGTVRYTEKQVAAWAARHPGPERFLERAKAGHLIFVAADDTDNPVAYALLEPDGHLDMLYCHPNHTRQGLADDLLAHCERVAQEMDASRLYTEASELARKAFERAGYRELHRRDFEIEGVAIHNYAMEKVL